MVKGNYNEQSQPIEVIESQPGTSSSNTEPPQTKPLTPQAPSGRLFQQLTESSQS